MPSINIMDEEKKRIQKLATEYGEKSDFLNSCYDKDTQTYFSPFDNTNNCVEYGFDCVPQLKDSLSKMWGGDPIMRELILPVIVSTFKGRPQKNKKIFTNKTLSKKSVEITIPDFIYVF